MILGSRTLNVDDGGVADQIGKIIQIECQQLEGIHTDVQFVSQRDHLCCVWIRLCVRIAHLAVFPPFQVAQLRQSFLVSIRDLSSASEDEDQDDNDDDDEDYQSKQQSEDQADVRLVAFMAVTDETNLLVEVTHFHLSKN